MSKDVFIHPQGICESEKLGAGTRVWAFAHVLPEAVIGRDCNICDHVFIENQVTLGDRVTVKCGVQIWDGIQIADDVFIGPNVTFTNDPFPRSKTHLAEFAQTRIGEGASIGANSTILPGITVGRNAMIGAGSVVTRSVPPNAIVTGNPARITGYAEADRKITSGQQRDAMDIRPNEAPAIYETKVPGVTLHKLPLVIDLRGSLSAGEMGEHIPFDIQRYFLVFDVPSAETRGAHAHRECHQFLICVSGQVAVVADDGQHREEFTLDEPNKGIHLPPRTWGIQYKYSANAVLLVFASHHYKASDYIRNYDEFLRWRGAGETN